MKCTNCQTENEPGARFCANCGSQLTTPSPAAVIRTPSRSNCPSCGQVNPVGSKFCESCGAKLVSPPQPTAQSAPAARQQAPRPPTAARTKEPTSWAWWLLPLFMFWVGGLIGFLVVKDSDQSKAKGLLIFGIIWTIVFIVIYAVGILIAGSLIDF